MRSWGNMCQRTRSIWGSVRLQGNGMKNMSHRYFWKTSGAGGFGHFVPAKDATRIDEGPQFRGFELLARDVGQYYAKAPRHYGLSFPAMPGRMDKRGVSLQYGTDLTCVLLGLEQWISLDRASAFGMQHGAGAIHFCNAFELPILDFKGQDPAVRMQDDKIRVQVLRAYRYVVPTQIAVIQLVFQPLREAPLAGLHASGAVRITGIRTAMSFREIGWDVGKHTGHAW